MHAPPVLATRAAATFAALALLTPGCTHAPSPTTPLSSTPAASTSSTLIVDCPTTWLAAPVVPASLAVPSDAHLLVHTSATGTQDYQCRASVSSSTAGATYGWTFVGPSAQLLDCHGAPIGEHFAREGNPTSPEWKTTDGTYVVGKKIAAEPSPETKDAVPWLLLHVESAGGSGPLARATHVQRVHTAGGLPPKQACTFAEADEVEHVAYSADYYFFGP